MSYFEQLLTSRRHRYFIMPLFALFLMVTMGSYLLWGDYRQQFRHQQFLNVKLQQKITTLNNKIISLPIGITPPIVSALPVFSVSEAIKKSAGTLVHWQPDAQQAKLEILLDWESVPRLFHHLGNYKNVHLNAFTINHAVGQRIVRLRLEFSYENK